MATLTNTQISVTYVGLLKTSGNTILDSTPQQITDGSGNNSQLFLSTAKVGIGATPSASELLQIAGDVTLGDNNKIKFGNSNDMSIFHDATDTFIDNATGNLNIRNQTDDGDINFICDNGSGGNATYFAVDGGGTDINFFKDTHHIDNVIAKFGSDSSGDLQIYHDSSNSFINNVTGHLTIKNSADDSDIIFQSDDGSGGLAEYFRVDGGAEAIIFSKNTQHADNVKAYFGNAIDLEIYHDGSNSYISDTGTGNLIIKGSTNIAIRSATDENYFYATSDGSVKIYYDNNAKLETTSSGIDVTGRMAINDGNNNVSIGDSTGDALTTGNANTAIGYNALSQETKGDRSVAVGMNALTTQNNTTNADIYNVGVGYEAGKLITTGDRNTLIGGLVGDSLTTGQYNIAIGYQALQAEDTGNRALAIGYQALYSQNNDTDTYNTAIGFQAGYAVTTGVQNTILGAFAGDALTTGSNNVAIGNNALSGEDAHGRS